MHVFSKQARNCSYNKFCSFDLAKSLGVVDHEYLNDLYVGGNAAYRLERFIQEIVSALVEVIKRKIVAWIQQSDYCLNDR